MTTEKLNQLLESPSFQEQSPRCLLIDEFDSFIFDHSNENGRVAKILKRFSAIFAFTGSDLLEYHRTYIEKELNARYVNMSNIMTSSVNIVCHGIKVFNLIPQFKSEVVQLCKRQTSLAPVIIIADAHRERIKKSLLSGGLPVEDISDSSPAAIESSLSVFSCKQSGRYPVFLVSEKQGRGIDFSSTCEIEQNGGIFVLIATLPKIYLQFKQFLGRTGRIGNKGQYAVMLYDKEAINSDGQVYLQKKLEELKNFEIIAMSNFRGVPEKKDDINATEFVDLCDIIHNDARQAIAQQSYQENIPCKELEVLCERTDMIQSPHSDEESKQALVIDIIPDNSVKESNDIYENRSRKREIKMEAKVEARYQSRLRPRDSLKADIDCRYFQGYSDPSIHSEMLQDSVRMESYQQAINMVCHGKVVIDVGAGTGVLSVMAAKAGALKVYAIEFSGIATQARNAIALNNVGAQVVVIQEKAEDVTLPIERVDVVLSEWMGYFLLFENMLPSVNHIRKQYLRDGGTMIPSRGSIHIAAFRRPRKDHGLNLSFFNKAMSSKAEIDICKSEEVVSHLVQLLDLDLALDELRGNMFESPFNIEMLSDGEITGLVGWFDVVLAEGVQLSTSPLKPATHWKQTLFYFDQPAAGIAGGSIKGQIIVSLLKRTTEHWIFKSRWQLQRAISLRSTATHWSEDPPYELIPEASQPVKLRIIKARCKHYQSWTLISNQGPYCLGEIGQELE